MSFVLSFWALGDRRCYITTGRTESIASVITVEQAEKTNYSVVSSRAVRFTAWVRNQTVAPQTVPLTDALCCIGSDRRCTSRCLTVLANLALAPDRDVSG